MDCRETLKSKVVSYTLKKALKTRRALDLRTMKLIELYMAEQRRQFWQQE